MTSTIDLDETRQRGGGRELGFMIVGTSRSGTTLLQRLACELPGVRVPPETQFFWKFGPRLLAQRTFPLNEQALRAEIAAFLDLKNSRMLRLDADAVVAELDGKCDHILELFSVFVRHLAGEAELYGEKSPQHLWWWRALTDAIPRLKLIVIVRDPRAVTSSNLKVPWSMDWHLSLAERWAFEQKQILSARRRLGDERCLVLRYEEVVRDPSASKNKIATFLGIAGGGELQSTRRDDAGAIFQPWETWKTNAVDPVTTSRINAWQTELTPSQVTDIVSVCRREMRRFGYDPELGAGAAAAHLMRLSPEDQLRRLRYRVSRYHYLLKVQRLSRKFRPV